MIIELLETFFIAEIGLIIIYLVRHYAFTLAVLKQAKVPEYHRIKHYMHYEPKVSLIIPAHNEEKTIGKLLQHTTEFTYPKDKLQIIIINDASSDGTGKIANHYANSCSFIEVLHRDKKVGGKGKASALNAGLVWATGEILLFLDADYSPLPDFVDLLVEEFADSTIVAVQGRPVVGNERKNTKTRIIALERIGGYRVDQEARRILNLFPQFGGTVGGFRSSVLRNLGGFDENVLAEDTDLTIQLCLRGNKVRYVGHVECYEEAVESWSQYWRQRHRWALGHMQVCLKHNFSVLKSKHLNVKEKFDVLLLLNVYFMPVLTLFSCIIGIQLILDSSSQIVSDLWFLIPISMYSFVGNFAPFFEVGIGAYLDGRNRIQWLCPLLIFLFLFNMLLCTKAFFDLILGKLLRRNQKWAKTTHMGTSNYLLSKSLVRWNNAK